MQHHFEPYKWAICRIWLQQLLLMGPLKFLLTFRFLVTASLNKAAQCINFNIFCPADHTSFSAKWIKHMSAPSALIADQWSSSYLHFQEWLLPPHAEPPGFLLHCVERAVHPPRAVWQHGRSQHVRIGQSKCSGNLLWITRECVFLLFNQIPDTTWNARLCSTLWRHWGICGPAGGEETLEGVQPKVIQSEGPSIHVDLVKDSPNNTLWRCLSGFS